MIHFLSHIWLNKWAWRHLVVSALMRVYWAHNTAVFHNQTCSEPEFVNILRSPGIDSQPGGPVRQPYLANRRPGYIGWRNRFLGIDPGVLKRLEIRGLEILCCFTSLLLLYFLIHFTSFSSRHVKSSFLFQCDRLKHKIICIRLT